MPESLSRLLARFAVKLTYGDMPDEVRDKVKARILHGIGTGLAAYDDSAVQILKKVVKAEEGLAWGGARIMADGSRVSRPAAASVNCALMCARNQHDSYRMLTHPGCQVVPAALSVAEDGGASGTQCVEAVAAGLEVITRLASNPEFIPAIQARGFRSSPIHGVFGAAVAAGKLLGLDEDQMVHTLALASTFSCGTVEGARVRGGEVAFQDPTATRNGVWAAILAGGGATGAESALEGEGGFYHAFSGKRDWDFPSVTDGLGERFEMTKMTSKQWPQTGYIQAPIWLSASLAKEHDLNPEEIAGVDVEMYYLETTYPSPAFPSQRLAGTEVTEFGIAMGLVERGYPQYGDAVGGIRHGPSSLEGRNINPLVPELMKRINISGTRDRAPYFPRMTVTLESGRSFTGELNGLEVLRFGLKEENELMKLLVPGLPIPEPQLNELVSLVNGLEKEPNVDRLMGLTVSPGG